MAKFTLTLEDDPADGGVAVNMKWEPPVEPGGLITRAQRLGVLVVKDLKQRFAGEVPSNEDGELVPNDPA